jgi:hypothetical protein
MFRGKRKKPVLHDNRMTVSAKHQEMLDTFEEETRRHLPAKQKMLDALRNKLAKLELKNRSEISAYDRDQIYKYNKQIQDIEREIQRIKEHRTEYSYHLKTAFLLSEYMKNLDEPNKTKKKKDLNQPNQKEETGIMSFFTKAQAQTASSHELSEESSEDLPLETKKFMQSLDKGRKRGEILDAFMQCVDDAYVPQKKYQEKYSGCDGCGEMANIEYDYQLGKNICGECGKALDYFFDPHFTSYKQSSEIDIQPEFPYKRINHFFELTGFKVFVAPFMAATAA